MYKSNKQIAYYKQRILSLENCRAKSFYGQQEIDKYKKHIQLERDVQYCYIQLYQK